MQRTVFFIVGITIALVNTQTPDPTKWRTIDGYGNNIANPTWGTPGSRLQRMGPAAFGDGISSDRLTTTGAALLSPRAISNVVHAPLPGNVQPLNIRGYTDFLTYWGQFVDHDLDLTGGPKGSAIPLEPNPIPVPKGDVYFDPNSYGNATIGFYRSVYDNTTSLTLPNGTIVPREQVTLVTSFLDGSQVYGSDNVTAAALRTFVGGLLKTTILNGLELPPLNTDNLTNANDAHVVPDNQLYLLGDVRGNENPALTSLHTIFIREHNRRARQLAANYTSWTDEQLYQEARRWVIALLQTITVNEYMPITIGDAADIYGGYNETINPTMYTEFSTGAFRYGHSEVSEWVWRVDANNNTITQGNLHLRDSYFNSPTTIAQVGVEPILLGMAYFSQNQVDLIFVVDLLDYLFGAPGSGGFDLTAINTKRGRDHGLPGINTYRSYYGLAPHTTWADIHPDPDVQKRLSTVYAAIDDCDVYVCGLAEFHTYAPGNLNSLYSNVGETFLTVINDVYDRFRTGDRFWFENGQWSDAEVAAFHATTLRDVIVRNTPILANQLQCFVFSGPDGCGKPIQPPAPTYSTHFDFNITLGLKTPAHPLYGIGHPYGFSVNGVEGGTIKVQRGQSYTFWTQISCAHSLVITSVPDVPVNIPGFNASAGDGDDGGTLPNAVIRNFGCVGTPNKEIGLVVVNDLPEYIFYVCDFHVGMGGMIQVLPAASAGVSLILQPFALLAILFLVLMS